MPIYAYIDEYIYTYICMYIFIYSSVPLMSDKEYEEIVHLAISETMVTRASSLW